MTDHTPPTDQQLAAYEALATAERLTPGPWDLAYEGCDCGGDYPCGHGPYVTGVVTPVPTSIAADRCKRTGEQPRDYDFHRSEIGDFPEADLVLMVAAREALPALVAEVRRLPAERANLIQQRDQIAMDTVKALASAEDGNGLPETGTGPCGHDDYHDPHEWADQPGMWCPGHSVAEDGDKR